MAGPKPVGSEPLPNLVNLMQADPNMRRITDPKQRPCAADIDRCVAEHYRRERAKWEQVEPRTSEEESVRARTAPVAVAKTLVSFDAADGSITDIYTDGNQDRATKVALSDPRLRAAQEALRFGAVFLARSGLGLTDGRLQLTIEGGAIDASASAWFRGAERLTMTASDTDGDQVHDYVIVAVRRGAELLVVDYKAVPSTVSTR